MTHRKIKILMVNPSSKLGGGTTISNSLALGLDRDEFEVYSFFPNIGPATAGLSAEQKIKVLTPKTSVPFSSVSFLSGFLRDNQMDIVHAQGTRAAFWVKMAYLRLKRRPKLVYTLHGLHIVHRLFYQRWPLLLLERATNKMVDSLVCVSISVEDAAKKYRIADPSDIKMIYNGVDLEKFSSAKPMPRRDLDLPDNALLITAVQRLDYPKDLITVIRAFKRVRASVNGAYLAIVGTGPLLERLKLEVRLSRLENRVLFLGDRNDVPGILAASDIAVLSSEYEALGLSLVEAMAAGKPVVGSDVEGINEVISDGKDGFLVKFRDARKMSEKMLYLLNNEDVRNNMGASGQASVRSRFSLGKMLSGYGGLYRDLLAGEL